MSGIGQDICLEKFSWVSSKLDCGFETDSRVVTEVWDAFDPVGPNDVHRVLGTVSSAICMLEPHLS